MLGIRRHHGLAIDLFQGDLARFVADGIVVAAPLPAQAPGSPQVAVEGPGPYPSRHTLMVTLAAGGRGPDVEAMMAMGRVLSRGDELGLRHLAMAPLGLVPSQPATWQPVAMGLLAGIKAFAETSPLLSAVSPVRSVRRVTLVLSEGAIYLTFREALQAIFPEQDP